MTPEQIAEGLRFGTASVYHYPCGRRSVVVGRWGRQLAHPSDCPDCARIREILITKEARRG